MFLFWLAVSYVGVKSVLSRSVLQPMV